MCYKFTKSNSGASQFLRPGPFSLERLCIASVIALVFLVPVCVEAQTGNVSISGVVSETVDLSVLPNSIDGNVVTDVVHSGNTVTVLVSGGDAKQAEIRVPLLVRSNSRFKISAVVEPRTEVTNFSIIDVRGTGTLVSPAAISDVRPAIRFDVRDIEPASNAKDLSRHTVIVSGPRVSLGGTLNSPNNALQITVLIRLELPATHGQLVRLSFAAEPESLSR